MGIFCKEMLKIMIEAIEDHYTSWSMAITLLFYALLLCDDLSSWLFFPEIGLPLIPPSFIPSSFAFFFNVAKYE